MGDKFLEQNQLYIFTKIGEEGTISKTWVFVWVKQFLDGIRDILDN
jgi:hypothetical protein